MPRRPRITEEERALFRSAVADAKPLPESEIPARTRPRPKPRALFREADERDVVAALAEAIPDGDIEMGDELQWRANGVQDAIIRKLRRGQFRAAGDLDLHGLNANEAKLEVAGFIAAALERGITCIRIIHGKGRGSRAGRPVLKQLVSGWLKHHADVLAFVSARPVDGGTGAVLVLLKRKH